MYDVRIVRDPEREMYKYHLGRLRTTREKVMGGVMGELDLQTLRSVPET